MLCPQCNTEYREGFTQCADCDVPLIEATAEEEGGEPDVELVKIWEGGNPAIIPLIESVFNDAGIEFMARSEGLQDLFALGRFGNPFGSTAIGPVEIWVRRDEEAAAREIVETLEQAPPLEEEV